MDPYQLRTDPAHGDPVTPRRIARDLRSEAGCPRGDVPPLLLVPGFPLLSGLILMLGLLPVLGLLLLESASPLQAQPLPPRQATVTAGIGNAQGWVGFQGEYYFVGERLSAFGGVGYTPRFDVVDPKGPTFAGGLRGYTSGSRHRAFLELSVAQIATQRAFLRLRTRSGQIVTLDARHLYGPGLQAGYQYTAGGGFTLMASAGAGYALGVDDRPDGVHARPMLGLGVGYTFR